MIPYPSEILANHLYSLVSRHDSSLDTDPENLPFIGEKQEEAKRNWVHLSPWGLLHAALGIVWVGLFVQQLWRGKINPHDMWLREYTPGAHTIQYEYRQYNTGHGGDVSVFQQEVNGSQWKGLIAHGFIDLTREELEKLGNERVNMIDGKVVEFKADPDVHYIGGIGAFHQIHCLYLIRAALWANITPAQGDKIGMGHIEHCLDRLFQAVRCHPDIDVEIYPYDPETKKLMSKHWVQGLKVCRNWDAVQEWADSRESIVYGMD